MDWLAEVFRFTGRARRRTYWIINIVASLAVLTAAGVMMDVELATSIPALVAGGAAAIVGIVAMLAASVRRLHDRNRSGWWMLLYGLVPALFGPSPDASGPLFPALPEALNAALAFVSVGVSIWALVDLGILRGTTGANRFGANPKGLSPAEVFD